MISTSSKTQLVILLKGNKGTAIYLRKDLRRHTVKAVRRADMKEQTVKNRK
jgi:hypothetical protein